MSMTIDEIKAKYPELAKQAAEKATREERQRLKDIDDIAGQFDPFIIAEAKYGPNPCTAGELALRAAQAKTVSRPEALMAAGEAAAKKFRGETE